jgi:hypothetical protein
MLVTQIVRPLNTVWGLSNDGKFTKKKRLRDFTSRTSAQTIINWWNIFATVRSVEKYGSYLSKNLSHFGIINAYIEFQ